MILFILSLFIISSTRQAWSRHANARSELLRRPAITRPAPEAVANLKVNGDLSIVEDGAVSLSNPVGGAGGVDGASGSTVHTRGLPQTPYGAGSSFGPGSFRNAATPLQSFVRPSERRYLI